MDILCPLVDNIFNGQRFQKFSTVDQETGDTIFVFWVDEVEVARREWTQLREEAIQADLRRGLIQD